MVVTRLLGGFGNQLFQFATGYALAKQINENLVIDASAFSDYKTWPFALDNFNLRVKVLRKRLLTLPKLEMSLFSDPPFLIRGTPFVERSLRFDKTLTTLKSGVILEGYWQSENYFSAYKAELSNIFIDPKVASRGAVDFAEKCQGRNSCSVHVRRGDFVSKGDAISIHDVCGATYFDNAMQQIRELTPDIVFYIFSDDQEWAKESFAKFKDARVVDISEGFYDDFYMMNFCEHSIIANSTYSWWAAWLKTEEGIIVAPSRWLNDPELNKIEIVPDRWLKIDP
ncbi:MAG: alpha-1,2-fucosyltransferase [Bdellovibrionales bacterium]|nr:alpha-1,2-fucosyltransferase [Bdellovibrionales bacterium]